MFDTTTPHADLLTELMLCSTLLMVVVRREKSFSFKLTSVLRFSIS